jgi:SNF2 family DNA or RNA helicase
MQIEFKEVECKFNISSRYQSFFQIESNQDLNYSKLTPSHRKLLLLVDEGLAEWNDEDCEVSIPWQDVYQLSRDEMDILDLPEFYPYALDLDLPHAISDPKFSITINYRKPSGDLIVKPIVKGGYIRINEGEEYIFDERSYQLIRDIDHFNTKQDELNNPQRWKVLAEIVQDLKEANRDVPTEFEEYEIVPMEKFSVNLEEQEDGALSVLPVPMSEDHELDDTDPELSEEKVQKRALSEEEQEKFEKQFKRGSKVRDRYLLQNRKLLVYDQETLSKNKGNHEKDVLSQFKDLQNLKGEEKEEFINAPGTFLNAEHVDLSEVSERVREIGQYQPTVLPFIPKSENEWFPEEGGVLIDGEQVRLEPESRKELIKELEKAIEDGRDEVTYNDRDYPATQETLNAIKQLDEATERNKQETEGSDKKDSFDPEDSNNTILIIKDNYFEDDGFSFTGNARQGEIGLPVNLADDVNLYSHQEDGVKWMQKLWINGEKGGLLADDMGLGKTMQALLFAAWIKEQRSQKNNQGPVLVAAPLTLLDNWCREYEKFLDRSIFGEPLQLHGSTLAEYKMNGLDISNEREIDEKNHDIEELINSRGGLLLDVSAIKEVELIVTTYEAIRDYQFSLSRINWSLMILDEIQKIKNPETLVSKAVKAMNYEFGLGLTGTPVENSWSELWSIMDFVQPGRLGSLSEFNERYQKKLDEPGIDQEALGLKLKKHMGDSIRRRMKEDHIEGLPERRVEAEKIELTEYQKQRYSEVVKEANSSEGDRHILTLLGALRDISLCPYLPYKHEQKILETPSEEIVGDSAKIERVFTIIENNVKPKAEKVIIFLISRKMQAVLQRLITERYGFRPYIINGTVSGGRRQKLVDKFQESEGFNLIIMSPEAAGVGLNVTAANHVIHLSRPWNPAKEDQASDRVYRINQEKDVTIYVPITHFPELGEGQSFDEKLHKLLESKRNLSKSVLLPAKVDKSELMSIGDGMFTNGNGSESKPSGSLSIKDVDELSGHNFEKFCKKLFSREGYTTQLTETNDQGADIVAVRNEGKAGILIQCKIKQNPSKNVSNNAVQEIVASKSYYEDLYKDFSFTLLVITNAKGYTQSAGQLAKANDVQLWGRSKVKELIEKHDLSLGALAV